jgi:hypothetical protein
MVVRSSWVYPDAHCQSEIHIADPSPYIGSRIHMFVVVLHNANPLWIVSWRSYNVATNEVVNILGSKIPN